FAQTHGPGELTPLVGRARELGMLLDAWEQARLGRGSAIVLTGEPGVGKSRLLQELHARLPRHTSIWAMCQCWSQVENSPYSPVIDLFERMFGIGKADPVARKLEKLDETLATQRLPAEYQPVLASFLSLPVPADAPFLSLSRRQQKERTRELMMALLRRQTETEEVPIGLVFEDLHWADPSTLELLGYVLERIQDMRVLILMSARPEFEPPWRPRPWLRRMFIERLSTAETETLVGEVARGRSLSRTLVEELATRAGGVPLFVEELTRMVLRRTAGGVSPPPAAELPDTLQRLLRARLDRLPRRLGELTQWAAVAGRSFSSTLLAQARGVEEAALRRELSLLVTRGLLEREPSAESIYHFRHPLLHEVAYRSRTRSDTRALHAEFARVLALRHAEGLEAQPELLAYHYTEAGKDALAIHQWAKAADVASQRSAYVEAAGLLRRALSLVRKLPESADRNREELSLLIRLGLVLMECEGCSEDGERVYRRIRELMGALGEDIPRVMEVSPWGAFAFIFARGEFQSAYELTVQLMELGRQTRTPYLLVLGHRAQATVLFTWGRMEAAREHVERALAYSHFDPECQRAVARQALAGKHWVDPLLLARAYATVVYSGIGLARRADELARETERMARLLDHPHSTAAALMYLSLACQVRGEPEGVIHWADQV
ncbi:MAG TPA: AAA family ATPase, partial [Longimicrobium sp.]|nr:AAA family ATPase [Longimicrobium sp.]